LPSDDPRIVTLFCIWNVLGCSIISALPPVRFLLHNTFESAHRLSGWSLLALLALHISFAYWKAEASARAVFNSAAFWIVGFMLFLAVFPWARQEYTTVSIDVPLAVVDEKAEAELAKRGRTRRATTSPPHRPDLKPGLGMIMTLKDAQFGSFLGLGTAQPGTGTRFSSDNWEFHSFISVSAAPGIRQIQAMFEEYMHAHAKAEVAALRTEVEEIKKQIAEAEAETPVATTEAADSESSSQLQEQLAASSAALARSEQALSHTCTGAEFLAKHRLGEVYHNLIARAGDWTGRLMDEAVRNGVLLHDFYGPRIRYERQLHARRYKAPGFGLTASLYDRVLVVATGGGIAGALPYAFRHLNANKLRERRKKEWDYLQQQQQKQQQQTAAAGAAQDVLHQRQASYWNHSAGTVQQNVRDLKQYLSQEKPKAGSKAASKDQSGGQQSSSVEMQQQSSSSTSVDHSASASASVAASSSSSSSSSSSFAISSRPSSLAGGSVPGFDPPNFVPEDPLSSACVLDPGAANIGYVHVLWVCRSPAQNYREMYEALAALPPGQFTLIDTAEINSALVFKFLPQLCVSLAQARECDAVCIVSGPQLSNAVVNEARRNFIPAYQASFDS